MKKSVFCLYAPRPVTMADEEQIHLSTTYLNVSVEAAIESQ